MDSALNFDGFLFKYRKVDLDGIIFHKLVTVAIYSMCQQYNVHKPFNSQIYLVSLSGVTHNIKAQGEADSSLPHIRMGFKIDQPSE